MEYSELITGLRLGDFDEVLKTDWDLSEKTYPVKIAFLEDDFVRKKALTGGLDSAATEYLVSKALPMIRENKYLPRLFWHQYHLLYVSENPEKPGANKFPHLEWILGDAAYSYNMLLAMAGYPRVREIHEKLGIPENIRKDTYSDLSVWCEFYKQSKNVVGFTPRILSWMQGHLNGKLFRVGRFQYKPAPFHYKFRVFRNMKTSEVLLLSDSGLKINRLGLRDGVGGDFDPGAWETEYLENADFAEGNPVVPTGYIIREKRKLHFKEWQKVLDQEEMILDIHIPSIGPMNIELCADSLSKAAKFFKEYFPEKDFKGFVCNSWFLDNQFEKLLSDTSNIIKLQREFYLFPVTSGGHEETIWRVFGETAGKAEAKDYPRKTSMQKTFAEFVEKGGKFRGGGAFYLKEDLPFGRHIYKKNP